MPVQGAYTAYCLAGRVAARAEDERFGDGAGEEAARTTGTVF